MSDSRALRHRALRARARRRRALLIAVPALVLVAALGVGVALVRAAAEHPAEPSTPASTPPSAPPPAAAPLSPAEKLLAETADPRACAVSFAGDAVALDPLLQWQGELHTGLPVPVTEGRVFAGWYPSAAEAAGRLTAARVNGADPVECVQQQRLLHAGWTTPEDNLAEDTQVAILMYHQFTTRPEGEDGWLRGNYAYIGDFDAHMAHLVEGGFYLPTWDELSAFIDGRLFLPARSVIVTDDDADQTWFDLAVPVVDHYGVLATSFMITADRQDPAPSRFVLRRSHTHDMHRAGADGRGRIVTAAAEEIVADLTASAEVVGAREVIAYPFGHHNDAAKQAVSLAGYEMARTIEPGRVGIGADKLALPVVRINYGMGRDALAGLIG